MQSSFFIYNQQDRAVARNNLLAMAQDVGTQDKVGVGSNNSGWCHAFAPLRQFLADPRFIRLLRKYKARYYYNGQLQPNWDFIKAMYDIRKNKQYVKNVTDILNSLCKHTDAYGRLLPLPVNSPDRIYNYYTFNTKGKTIQKHVNSPYAYLIKLVHRIFPDGKQNYTGYMYNYLSDCTAIMSESAKILACKDDEKIYANQNVNSLKIKEDLDKGLCIVAAANGHHVFNIYKDDQNKYRLLGVREEHRRPFNSLIDAIQEIQPKAYTPEQQYWLCEKIKEKQLGQNKKAGINKYLETHTSYLNQPSNQHGFHHNQQLHNQNQINNIHNNIMNQNNFGISNNQQNNMINQHNMNIMMSNMNILNRNGNNNMINQRNINNINNFNNNMMGNNMINQHNFGPQPINNMMMNNMNIMNNNVNWNMRQGNGVPFNQQGRNFK